MALIADGRLFVGKTYMLINKADGNRALAVWRDSLNAAGNLSNVCILGTNSNDTAQHWKLVKINSNYYAFQSVANPEKCLDLYTGSGTGANSNAHLYTPSETSYLDFEVGTYSNTVRIKLAGTTKNGYYLTANVGSDGTKDGKSNTDAGNVFFQKYEIYGDAKDWIVNLISTTSGGGDDTTEESDYSTGYYRFSNGGHYLTGTTNSVTAAAVNGQTTQTWNFRYNNLYTENSSNYGIAGTSSATMSTSPNGVVLVSAGTNKCYIKLSGSNKYLQRSSTTVSWGTTPTEWTIEEVVRKIGVPHMGTEYFSKDSGLSNGIWFDSYSDIVRNFYKKVYDVDTVSDANCFYNLYGALMVNSGCFHCGIDMKLYDGAPIKAPFSGKVTRISENYGRVYLYNETLKVTFVFLHMDVSENISQDDVISEGTIIGTQSGYGENSLPNDFGSHLHVEIHTGEHDGGASVAPEYSYKPITSSEPYEWLGQV